MGSAVQLKLWLLEDGEQEWCGIKAKINQRLEPMTQSALNLWKLPLGLDTSGSALQRATRSSQPFPWDVFPAHRAWAQCSAPLGVPAPSQGPSCLEFGWIQPRESCCSNNHSSGGSQLSHSAGEITFCITFFLVLIFHISEM